MLTVLLPCKDQLPAYLSAAVESVLAQDDPNWELVVIFHPDTPAELPRLLPPDARVRWFRCPRPGLAGAVNGGMEEARSEFVTLLLSDDLLDGKAVGTFLRHIQAAPEVDFFSTARCYVDADGEVQGDVLRSPPSFRVEDFKRFSPVKHAMCWRRQKALALGGLDEELTLHGCDDYDFPWRMAQAGCRFLTLPDCLYYYRVHHNGPRLTTDASLQQQVDALRTMFRKRGLAEEEIRPLLRQAAVRYLMRDRQLSFEPGPVQTAAPCREMGPTSGAEFAELGLAGRYFFPHRLLFLPRSGPDGLELASRLGREGDAGQLWEILLYASAELVRDFPADLFLDDDLYWHQQHLGLPGLVASATVAQEGEEIIVYQVLSDLLQRAALRPEHKSRLENRFRGWARLLLNGVRLLGRERGAGRLRWPSAGALARHTSRPVNPSYFQRLYDQILPEQAGAGRVGDWWEAPLGPAVAGAPNRISLALEKTICLCHDVEEWQGHSGPAPELAPLEEMLAVEERAGVRATYQVVGELWERLSPAIRRGGHGLAFHSYDHQPTDLGQQLHACRMLDARVRGYRPPQSRMPGSPRLEQLLAFYNFAWVASSAASTRALAPVLQRSIVRIPILIDDFALYQGHLDYPEWEARLLRAARENRFLAVCLHDCYARSWLPHYEGLLEKLRSLGELRTLDEVADRTVLASAYEIRA